MGRPRKNPLVDSIQSPSKKLLAWPRFFDINTDTDFYWEVLLKRFSKTARVYGFSRVETPLVEDTRLFQSFYEGLNQNALAVLEGPEAGKACLRPSQLPGLMRSFYQQKLYEMPVIHKWHYAGFVVNRDADSTLKTDYEFGAEILGDFNHLTEAQTIGAAWEFISSLGLEDLVLEVNNLGTAECQKDYSSVLAGVLSAKKYELCDDCNEHLSVRPLNVFRCANFDCQAVLSETPTILDFLDQDSHKEFTYVLEALDEMGIAYQLNSFYAGLNGNERTNFAIKYKDKDKTVILAEGGHHSGLVKSVSGKTFKAFGFSGSFMNLYRLMAEKKLESAKQFQSEVCLVPLGDLAARRSLRLFKDLTASKISVYDHFGSCGVKNQLKVAVEQKVPIALIMGQKEAMDEMVILRDVKSGMQEIISYDKIIEEVKKRLGK